MTDAEIRAAQTAARGARDWELVILCERALRRHDDRWLREEIASRTAMRTRPGRQHLDVTIRIRCAGVASDDARSPAACTEELGSRLQRLLDHGMVRDAFAAAGFAIVDAYVAMLTARPAS